jgi:Ca2+-binding RTX toxin-like protein
MGAPQEDDMAVRKTILTTGIDAADFDTMAYGPGLGDPLPTPGLSIQGTAGNDMLTGTSLNDMILGLGGNDRLYGEDGNDTLDGGLGDDTLVGGKGADAMIGGAGIDTASYTTATSAITAQLGLQGTGGDAEGDTYSGIENLTGSSYSDMLIGDAGSNVLSGGRGNDHIIGGAGIDVLIAGGGSDILTGDTAGVYAADLFVIGREASFASYDRITDFQGGSDKIGLIGFNASAFGNDGYLATGALFDGVVVHHGRNIDASDTLFFDRVSDKLYEVEIQMGSNGPHLVNAKAIVQIDMPDQGFSLRTSDFLFL